MRPSGAFRPYGAFISRAFRSSLALSWSGRSHPRTPRAAAGKDGLTLTPFPVTLTPFPAQMRVELDSSVQQLAHRTLLGGRPRRLLRLSAQGERALRKLSLGDLRDPGAAALARRLTDIGLAHPHPACQPLARRITVVIPVRDRLHHLEHCLESLPPHVPVCIVDDGSTQKEAVKRLAAARSATLVRHSRPLGPAAARNAGLRQVRSELVAFLDSDCTAPPHWLQALIGHFDDPLLLAVAPRVRPLPAEPLTLVGRYLQARSPLDLRSRPARVLPHAPVAYLPSAALIVRREAVLSGFDEDLRHGEDVDLVWRLCRHGRVRYDPSVEVLHAEPSRLHQMLRRRFAYGTSAGPLAKRHPQEIAPLLVDPLPALAIALLLAGFPSLAAGIQSQHLLCSARRLRTLALPVPLTARLIAQNAFALPTLAIARHLASCWLPVSLSIAPPRGRRIILAAIVADALLERRARAASIDPARWTGLMLADELAYGAGVWWGSLKARALRALAPVLPRVAIGAERSHPSGAS